MSSSPVYLQIVKTILASLLLLVGCAYGPKDPLPEPQPTPRVETHLRGPEGPAKVCYVDRTEDLKGCTLYVSTCGGQYEEYYLVCETQPMGEITNPPMPVEE